MAIHLNTEVRGVVLTASCVATGRTFYEYHILNSSESVPEDFWNFDKPEMVALKIYKIEFRSPEGPLRSLVWISDLRNDNSRES